MPGKPSAHSVAEFGLHTLEKLVGEGDLVMAGIVYDMTAANLEMHCDVRQEARLRSVGEVLGKLEPQTEVPAFDV